MFEKQHREILSYVIYIQLVQAKRLTFDCWSSELIV